MKNLEKFLSEGNEWFKRYIKTIREYANKIQESEEWLSTTLNSIGDAVIATDKSGNVRFMNPVAEALTGWKQEEATGKPLEGIFNIINEENNKKAENPVSRVLREGNIVGLANHTILIAKDGKKIPIADSGAPIQDDKGNIVGVVLIFRDITELKKSEKKLKDVIQFLPDATFMIDTEGKVIFWNKAMEEMTNVKAEEILNKGNYEYALPFYGKRRPILIDLVLNSKNNFESEYYVFDKIGDTLISEVFVPYLKTNGTFLWGKARPLYDFQGIIIGAIETIRDITESKKAEQKIIHLNNVLRAVRNVNQLITKEKDRNSLLQRACNILIEIPGFFNAWIALIDSSNKVTHVFEAGIGEAFSAIEKMLKKGKITKCAQKAMLQTEATLIEDPYSTCRDCPLSNSYGNRASMTIRLEHERKVFGWLTVSIPNELVEGEQELFEEVGGDIAFALYDIDREEKHREAEKRMIKSEEKYHNLVNDMREMIGKIEANGEIVYASPQTFELMGFRPEEVIGKNWFKSYVHPEDFTQIANAMKGATDSQGGFESFDFRMRHKDGHYIHVSGRGKIIKEEGKIKYIASFRDITKRTLAEQELRKSESLYHMAYDRANFYKDLFAHDMNNILQAILSGLQLSEIIFDDPDKREALKTNLRIMKNQIIRGANLISNVRKLSQLEEIELPLKKIEICNILKNLISTLKNTYQTKNFNIQVHSIGKKLHVQANDFLVDVFENILINSVRHNRNPSVEVTVKISRAQKNSVNYLKMEFQDNGKGIANSWKENIFQRGYTEEKSVQGMGLGLSLVKKIIKNYNGEIWVEDRIKGDHSKGSNFILLIPEVN